MTQPAWIRVTYTRAAQHRHRGRAGGNPQCFECATQQDLLDSVPFRNPLISAVCSLLAICYHQPLRHSRLLNDLGIILPHNVAQKNLTRWNLNLKVIIS